MGDGLGASRVTSMRISFDPYDCGVLRPYALTGSSLVSGTREMFAELGATITHDQLVRASSRVAGQGVGSATAQTPSRS